MLHSITISTQERCSEDNLFVVSHTQDKRKRYAVIFRQNARTYHREKY